MSGASAFKENALPKVYTPVQHAPISCSECSETFTPKHVKRKYCYSNDCAKAHRRATVVDSTRECSECGRSGVLGRGLCPTHYSLWHRARATHQLTCKHCGKEFTHNRKGKASCSPACQQAYTRATEGWQNRAIVLPPVRLAKPKPPKMTEAERAEVIKKSRSAIRAAYEDQEWPALLDAIKANSTVTIKGCWEWSRRSKDNYPVVSIARKWHQVHRLSLHAKHGKPLGVLAAHHKCANSMCVNPKHLQPVTHRENTAEMLARTSLEARIEELESALRAVAPTHEVLDRISAVA